jgi:serine/threonine-protein kinase
MSGPTPANPAADRNLLYGMLALQMGFVNRDALLAGMRSWVFAKERPLGMLLQEQKALTAQQHQVLDAVVAEHIKAHGGDPQRSLAAAAQSSAVDASLESVADAELQASLAASGMASTVAELLAVEGMRYHVLRPHASGGLGLVSVARDRELGREVALKEIQDTQSADELARSRFVREAEITGGLEHPGIVPVYGLGRYPDGRPYYAMRFIRGESLQEAVRKLHAGESGYTLRGLLTRFVAVCNAVAYAHSRGVLHRDLKPANVMLGPYGETLVVDWGLAKVIGREPAGGSGSSEPTLQPQSGDTTATRAGSALGTPTYMSPEQARGDLESLGPATDVYSLGATLYNVVTGKPPFQGRSSAEVVEKVRQGDWLPPRQVNAETPAALDAICRKAMSLKAETRYSSALDLAADVERWLADEPVTAYREPARVRIGRWIRRHRTRVAVALATLTMTVVALVVVAVLQAEAGRRLADKNRDLAATNLQLSEAREGLAEKNGELEQANQHLATARDRAERRVDLAVGAIESFRSAVDDNLDVKSRPENAGLRKQLLQAPLAFYKKLRDDLKDGDDNRPEARAKLADAYYHLAALNRDLGSQSDALTAFDEATALLEPLTRAAPEADQARLREQLARALVEQGELQSDSKALTAAALESLGRARTLREAAARDNPSDVAARVELARTLDIIALLQARGGDVDAALATLRGSLATLDETRRIDPGHVGAGLLLARTHQQVSNVLRDHRSRLPEAHASADAALAIIEPLAKAHPTDLDCQNQLASAYQGLGDVEKAEGEFEKSLETYRKQLALIETMLRARPAFNRLKHDRVTVLVDVAAAQYRTGRNAEGLATLQTAQALAESLTRDNPTNVQFKKTLSLVLNRQAVPLSSLGRTAEALAVIEAGTALLEEVARTNSDDVGLLENIAGNCYNCGLLNKQLGRVDAALAAYDRSLEMREKLSREHPEDPWLAQDVASTLGNIASIQLERRRYPEARATYERAIGILARIAGDHPENAEFQNYLLRARQNLAATMMEQGQVEEALKLLRTAQEPSERMARERPDVVQYQLDLASVLQNLAKVLKKAGQVDEAIATTRRAVDIREKLLKSNPGDLENRDQLAQAYEDWGDAERDCGRPGDAVKQYRRFVEVYARVPNPTMDQHYNHACALARLVGIAAVPGSGLTAADGQAEGDKAIAALRRAVDAGFRDADAMRKDTDLEPLRKRPDFQNLQDELDAKSKAKPVK